MAVFLRKLLRIGKLPSDLRAEVEAEGIISIGEYVPSPDASAVRCRASIRGQRRKLCGRAGADRSAGARHPVVGAEAGRARTIDQRWDAPQAGAAKAELSETGLVIEIDVADVDATLHGAPVAALQGALDPDVLERLPRRSLAYDVPPEFVFRAVGVPYHP